MAINNQFGFNQGFGQTGFQQTGFQSPQPTYKTQNNKYPGVDDEMLKRIEQLADSKGLKGQDKENFMQSAYRQVVSQAVNNTQLKDRDTQINNMCYNAAVSGNKGEEVASRVSTLAQDIKKRYPEHRKANDDDNEVIQWFVGGLMDKGDKNANQKYCDYIEKGDNSFLYDYNLENAGLKEETGISGLGLASIGLGALGVNAYGLSYLGKPIEKWGKAIYGNVIPTSEYEASQLEKAGEANKELKLDIKDQKAEVKRLKKEVRNAVGEEKVQLQAQLDEAKDTLTKLKETPKKEVRTAVDTALEENLKGTKKGIAEEAGAIRNRIWKKQIQPIFDANPDTEINLKDVFSEFEAEAKNSVAKLDGKKQKEVADALKKLNEQYNSLENLEHAKIQDVQDFKSSIQKDLKDVYQKQAKNGEITTYDRLLEKYVSKIKDKLQEKLQELSPSKKIKDLYKKWAENDRIAEQGIKENLLKGDVKENIIKKGRQQIESRVGKSLAKQGKRATALKEFVNKTAKNIAKEGKGILKNLGKGGVKALAKKGIKGLLDPVALVMPTLNDIQDQDIGMRYKDIKQYIEGTQSKLDKKRYEGVDMRSLAAQLYNDVKENKEIKHSTILDRKTTPREILEEMGIDPDERLAEVKKYLNDTSNSGGR